MLLGPMFPQPRSFQWRFIIVVTALSAVRNITNLHFDVEAEVTEIQGVVQFGRGVFSLVIVVIVIPRHGFQ